MISKLKTFIILLFFLTSLSARDLKEIKDSGYIVHLGVPYANFVTGLGDGLDVELIKGFAKYIGVKYKYQASSWNNIYGDLIGQNVKKVQDKVVYLNETKIKGDLIANGFTILPWREEVLNFSLPTFPSAVWVVAKSDSKIKPITPTNSIKEDIKSVKKILSGQKLLTRPNTCLDASLYNLERTNTEILIHSKDKKIIEMVPSILQSSSTFTLLDVPDALIALDKWSGEIKVLGPISEDQFMGVGFKKESKELLEEFNKYFSKIKEDGTYNKMVRKYYPSIFYYYDDFFK